MAITFACQPHNDLYQLLGAPATRHDSPADALAAAPDGGAVALLADAYPVARVAVDPDALAAATARGVRVFIEYPEALPGLALGEPQATDWERGVVASDAFAPALEKGRIVALHGCQYLPAEAAEPWLGVARVAGLDTAVYGLPDDTAPILFEHDGLLVATTRLSGFRTARFAPRAAWQAILGRIVGWLARGETPALQWQPTVGPTYGRDEALPADAEARALARGVDWFRRSALLLEQAPESAYAERVKDGSVPAQAPLGEPGSGGIQEGYRSRIGADGSQPKMTGLRGDCIGESAMAMAFSGEPWGRQAAANALAFLWHDSIAQQGKRADPEHPAFGLTSWGVTSWPLEKSFYGDDNARLLLGTLAAAALLDDARFDEAVMRCLLANLRTTGRLGFRLNRVDLEELEANGWRHHFDAGTVSYAPHYQAFLWACYLWAYRETGYELFLRRAESALRLTMEAYPEQWRWTNGIAQEKARMLLPLAWLVRVDDTPEHREWLRRMATELLRLQAPSGAIHEELGALGQGSYGPPRSNEDYGKHEATLIQQNGDPVSDLLYTTNFAFIGLHEAAAATGEAIYRDAEDKLAAFLCRIQVAGDTHPELDGGWFRAFHDGYWEHWGSNADAGWGVWCIETGWTQGWIVGVLGLRQRDTSLWDLTADSGAGEHFDALHPLFFPDGDEPAGALEHLAVGARVRYAAPADKRYPGSGPLTLTDGLRGQPDHRDAAWQGFEGESLDTMVDLGRAKTLGAIRLTALQSVEWGILLPWQVEFAVSDDGETWTAVGTTTAPAATGTEPPRTHEFAVEGIDRSARYVRVRATNAGPLPDWHRAKGRPAWLFVDEIVVEQATGAPEA